MLRFILLIMPLVLPVLFWALYHYHKDRFLPEPISRLMLTFLLGVGSSVLAMLMYQSLDLVNQRHDAYYLAETNLPGLLVYSILVIGLVEELAKLLPFLLIVVRFRDFNEPIDGIIYASFIALGFATVENIQYMRFLHGAEALARGFAGPVVHIVFSSIWGYYIGRAHLCRRKLPVVIISTLAVTAILHGLYDFVVIAMPPSFLPAAALMIAGIWLWRLRLIGDLHNLPPGPCPWDTDAVPDHPVEPD